MYKGSYAVSFSSRHFWVDGITFWVQNKIISTHFLVMENWIWKKIFHKRVRIQTRREQEEEEQQDYMFYVFFSHLAFAATNYTNDADFSRCFIAFNSWCEAEWFKCTTENLSEPIIVVKTVSFDLTVSMHYGLTMEGISIMNKTAVTTDTAFSKNWINWTNWIQIATLKTNGHEKSREIICLTAKGKCYTETIRCVQRS